MAESYVEQRTVSRKTPKDGKLEISADAAGRLPATTRIGLTVDGRRGEAALVSLACTCRGDAGHVHHFLEAELFRTLVPDQKVIVRISSDGASADVEQLRAHDESA